MAQNLNQSVHRFNQEALKRELTAALIIQNQLHDLTDDMVMHYPSLDVSQELQKKIHASAEPVIKGMLQADSKEVFIAHKKRLDHLLTRLKEKFALDGDLDKALHDYRFYQQLQRMLRDMTIETAKDKKDNLPEWFLKHAEYGDWEKKLNDLRSLVEQPEDFDDYKHKLMADLILKQSQHNLANLASLALIKQNVRILADTRLSYLKKINDRKRILADLGWITVGVLLATAGAVLGLAFPLLIIPGLVLGAAALGHGVIDFAKESALLWSEIHDVELGAREVSENTIEGFKDLEQKIPGFEKDNFLERQDLHARDWSKEKKWQQGLGFAVAFVGLALAVAGLVFAIPALGILLGVVIAMTALAVTVTVLSVALWGFKVAREQEKLDAIQKEVENQISADQKMLSESVLGPHKKDELISSANTMLRELEEKKQIASIVQLKSDFSQDDVDLKIEENGTEPLLHQKKQQEPGITGVKGEEDDAEGEGEGESPTKTPH